MTMTRNLDTEENRNYWDFVEAAAKEVASWPEWKRGDLQEREERGQ